MICIIYNPEIGRSWRRKDQYLREVKGSVVVEMKVRRKGETKRIFICFYFLEFCLREKTE
jgi:hypothetical protein